MSAVGDDTLRDAIRRAVQEAAATGHTACPTDVARRTLGAAGRAEVARVRRVATGLADAGEIVFWFRGQAVDPHTFPRPVRFAAGPPDRG